MNKVVTSWGEDNETIFEVLPPVLTMAIAMAKYINGIYQTEKLKEILIYIKNDNEYLRNSPEYDVLHKFMMQGRRFLIRFTLYLIVSTVIYLTPSVVMIIYNEMHPINGTVLRETIYQVDYNVDTEKYFFPIMLHSYIGTILTVAMIGALDTMYMTLMQHACALFTVAGFRFKTAHILNANVLKEGKDFREHVIEDLTPEEQNQVYRKLILGVREHRNALKYIQLFQSIFSVTLFIQLFFNITCLSISGVMALIKINTLHSLWRIFVWMVGQMIHLFCICLPGQNLVNHSEKLYYDLLESMWYMFFKKSHVLHQFVLMNAMKHCKLISFKVVPMNMETFLSVTKTAVSYFTVLSSMR